MSLTATPIRRIFMYNGRTLPDPDTTMSPEEVKLFYSAIHADLTNAAVDGGAFEGDTQTFEFKRAIRDKG